MADWYIEYADIAVGADKAATITATEAAEFSNLKRVPFGADDDAYITLEHNSWVLDGTFKPLPIESDALGYWTSSLSNEKAEFTTHPTLTASLNDLFSSTGIQLDFSQKLNDFAASLTLSWYHDENQLATHDYTPDDALYFCRNPVEAYNKVVVEFKTTSKPYQRLKLKQLAFGYFIRFNPDDCLSIQILQELDPIAAVLPESKLNFEINTDENVSFMFQEKQPVKVYLDNEILGSFYIKSSKQTSPHRYTIEAEDAIGVLTDIPYTPAIYTTDTNAKAVVQKIVGDEFILNWSDDIADAAIKGYISAKNSREAIQQICFAIGAVCHTARSTGLIVTKLSTEAPLDISNENIYEGNSVERSAVLTSLNVLAHSYVEVPDDSGSDIIKVETDEGTKYYKHETQKTTITNPDIAKSAKRNVFEINEATLINTDNVAEIAQRVYDFQMKIKKHTLKFKRTAKAETLGAYVQAVTPFGEQAAGNLEHATISLSGIVAIDGSYRF